MRTEVCGRKICFCIMLLMVALIPAWAQQYSVGWNSADGGGFTSTGGVYSLSGTVGQPDAETLSGDGYSLHGGFWAFAAAVQMPGAPHLSITASGVREATISWDPETPGWELQQALSLSPESWTNAPSGATNPVVVPVMPPTRIYYRLFKP